MARAILVVLCGLIALAAGGEAAGVVWKPTQAGGRVWWKPWTWRRARPSGGCPPGRVCVDGSALADLATSQFNLTDIPQIPPNRWVMDAAGLLSADFVLDLHENLTDLSDGAKTSAYLLTVPHVPAHFDSLRTFARRALREWLGQNGTKRHERAVLAVFIAGDRRVEIAVGPKLKRKYKDAAVRRIARRATQLLKEGKAERAASHVFAQLEDAGAREAGVLGAVRGMLMPLVLGLLMMFFMWSKQNAKPSATDAYGRQLGGMGGMGGMGAGMRGMGGMDLDGMQQMGLMGGGGMGEMGGMDAPMPPIGRAMAGYRTGTGRGRGTMTYRNFGMLGRGTGRSSRADL